MSFRSAVMLLVLALTSACVFKQDVGVISSGERYTASTGFIEDYALGFGDQVRVTVFNEPTLSGDFSIGASGTLALPLIGEVPAAGKRIREVAGDTQSRLANGYLREPRVSMEVITYRPFFILGEVTTPGPYPYALGLTALNAVATAHGFTPRANNTVVRIRRAGSADEEVYQLTPDLRIYPGDTIRVTERFF